MFLFTFFRIPQGGHVRGSHNWAAQTFYDTLLEFYNKFKNTHLVIFYCQSSNGRGPRCAGWYVKSLIRRVPRRDAVNRYQDYLDAQTAEGSQSAAYVLQGGIKNWLKLFGGQNDLVEAD